MINLMPYCIVMNPLLAKPILSKLIDSVIYTLTFTSTLSSNNRNNIQYVRKMISLLVPISINYSTCKTCIYNIQNIDKTIPHHDIIVESILQLLIERYPITNNALSNFDMSSSVSNNSLSSSISTENGSELSHENSKNMPSISKHHMNSNISSNIGELEYFKRDEILLKIISILYKRFEYDIYTVLKIYLSIFENSLNESFIIYATNSLIEFCVKIKGGLNLSLIFPQIQKPLFKLFNTTQNIDLKASILHLFGCSFDSIDNYAPLIQNNAHSSLTYIDTLISLLLNKSYERHWIFYKIIASFFESDQEHYSDSYAQRVSQKIIHVLTVFRPPHQVELYQCLVIILEKCPYEAIPIMNDLIKMIKQNMHEKYCIKMLTIITQSVPIDYFELISSSYITVLELILISNKKYFRWAIRFITSAVVYFHLSIELYLNCLSNIEVNEDCLKFKIHEIKKSLIYVSKNVDISFYFTQFALMSSKFHFDPQLVLQKAAQYHKFEWILSRNNNQNDKIIIEDIDFQYKFYGKSFLDKFIPPDSYFNKKSFPIDLTNNSSEFTMRLIEFSYTNSPNTFFRNIAVIWRNFIKISLKTFPLVFLSIWKICSQEDKSYFSMLLNEILTLKHINSEIFRLIEYMDINGYKFEIDYWIVAQKTPSHHYSLIISQKFFVKSSFVPLFMYKTIFEASKKLDNRENFLPLFRVHKKNIDLDLRADGYYFLNEWGKALKLYQRVNSPLYKQVSCLFRMRKYDEIIAMSDQISSLEEETDKQNSLTMLMWIYSIRRENFKILDLLSKVKMSKRGNILFPLILYYISTQEYSKAQECLENAFRGFRNIKFTKGDGFNNQLKLNDLHILSELDEIAGLKAGKKTLLSTNLPELWTNRIFHFERNDSTWEMLIQIRSFIKPIHSNLSAYLPIIKALRKNGHFEMIHHYFDPHFDYIFDIEVFIERLKIQWAEGLTKESFNGIETTCACVIIKDINQYVYIGARWRVPFPSMTIYQCSLNPSFGTDIRDYVTEYFEAESFENSLLFLQKLSLKQQKDFFSHIILKFPECMYITFMNVMCNRKTFPHFFELAGKFAETIDTKLSYQYFNIARALKSNKTSSMKGWAIANLTLFLDSLNQSYFYQNSLKKDFNNRFVEIKNNQIEHMIKMTLIAIIYPIFLHMKIFSH